MTTLGRGGNLYSAIIQKNDRSEVNESKIAQLIVIVRMSGNSVRSAHEREQATGRTRPRAAAFSTLEPRW